MLEQRIGFIGAGQMAQALARGFLSAELVRGEQLSAVDVSPSALAAFCEAAPGAGQADDARRLVDSCEVIFLAVKPQHIDSVLAELRGTATAEKLFVSIAAGVPLGRLAAGLEHERVIRVMPNTPCLVQRGAAAYALGEAASDDDGRLVESLLSSVGIALRVEEKLLDAVTGLSGSGPAYAYTMIEAMSDAGVRMGLPRPAALQLAAQTVMGAAAMVLESGEHPAVLKDRVTSPAGTTIAGVQALEERGFRAALLAAVQAATLRSQELGQPAAD